VELISRPGQRGIFPFRRVTIPVIVGSMLLVRYGGQGWSRPCSVQPVCRHRQDFLFALFVALAPARIRALHLL
jgi:hypothetical protein